MEQNRKIECRAWVSDWFEADLERAARFAKGIMRLYDKKVFDRHFRGITYEEIKEFWDKEKDNK